MAFTTPRTWVAGEIATAANLNTYLRDNDAWIATDSPACRAYHNTTQSIANLTPQAVVLNSERFDNAAMHSTASLTSRITIPTGGGGKYIFGASWAWAISSNTNFRQGRAMVNGTTGIGYLTTQPNAVHASEGFITTTYSMAAADYFELFGHQDSGGGLNITSTANYTPEVWCFWFRT